MFSYRDTNVVGPPFGARRARVSPKTINGPSSVVCSSSSLTYFQVCSICRATVSSKIGRLFSTTAI